jgi:hypothetical protein
MLRKQKNNHSSENLGTPDHSIKKETVTRSGQREKSFDVGKLRK